MSTAHSGKSAAARSRSWAEKAGEQLADASATDVLAWAFEEFGSGLAIASSMADAVLPHLASRVFADTVAQDQQGTGPHVLFLDTGYHFEETLQTRDEVARRLPVTVRSITPRLSVADQDLVHGPDLFNTDPGACCHMRKVEPLTRALDGYQAWASGLRRCDSPSRADTPLVTWDLRHQRVKINPIAAWSDEDVETYIAEHDVPVNPLIKQGYPSIGCGPCTLRPLFGADPRSGRWAGTGKTECGLHV